MRCFSLPSSTRFLAVPVCLAALVASARSVMAAAPMAKTQVPGYYRMVLGRFEVTALSDGAIELDRSILRGAPAARIDELLARRFVTAPKMPTSVNAFLINTGTKLVLIDAGSGREFGPTLGRLPQNLRAAGYEPSQVDAVLVTHLHGDHAGGLLDAEGKAAYVNATVYVSKPEDDAFWPKTDAAAARKAADAPTDRRAPASLAAKLAGPYLAAGRWKTFNDGEEPIPGITARIHAGHTPGHTVFEVRDGPATLVVFGDLLHSVAVQFADPSVSALFDKDQKQSAVSRKSLLSSLAADKTLAAGAHVPFPGIGRVRAEGTDTYTWVPVDFCPVP